MKDEPNFLKGGGEMGCLIRSFDWSKTSLGEPQSWPQSLRTVLGILLKSKFSMFLFWGEESLCFYNDSYRHSMVDQGKHPQALGSPAAEVWPEYWEALKSMIDQVKAGGEATWNEDEMFPVLRDGEMQDVYWTYSFSLVTDDSGNPVGVLSTSMNTTDKATSMKKLADSKDQLHFAIEAAELGTWDYNLFTKKITGNGRLMEWFGLPNAQEMEISTVLATISKRDIGWVREAAATALKFPSAGPFDIEYAMEARADKQIKIVRVVGRARFHPDGRPYRFNGIMQDVTQQVMSRKRLEAEKQQFHTLLETVPNMTWTTDPAGNTTFLNRRWQDYAGISFGANFVQDWLAIIHPDDQDRSIAASNHALATQSIYLTEYRLKGLDGEYRWHLARALPVLDADETVRSWVGSLTDIHEQKQLEIELEKEVKLRTRQLEDSVKELQRSNQNLQQFAYIASHDLQEPLRKIQSFGDILKKKYAESLGDGADYLSRMQSAANRMSVLIEDLLIYSRISTRQEITSNVSLEEVLDEVLTNLELVTTSTRAEVTIHPLPTLPGDATQLIQLFQNLLSNALKFHEAGQAPAIDVSATKIKLVDVPATIHPTTSAAFYHRIDVRDNGIGFDEKYIHRIFEVFQRLHGKSQYSGTGIGLAICKKVVTSHGGDITASSQPGRGSTFSIYFPI